MQNKTIENKGFTIAEMLIVTIIIGVLTGIGTRTYIKERDRFQFNGGLIKAMEIIKTTRNFATTSYPVFIDNIPIVPPEGYGIYINLDPADDQPHFTVFANIGDQLDYRYQRNPIVDTNLNRYDTDNDVILEKYRLPKQVQFDSIFFDGAEQVELTEPFKPTETEVIILFRPPLAEVTLSDNDLKILNEIKLKFYNRYVPAGSTNEFQCITLNAVKTFPELSSGPCT